MCAKIQTVKEPLLNHFHRYELAGVPLFFDPFWLSASLLWTRPWFQRVWTMQEVILAKKITFMCGARTADFEVFSTFTLETERTSVKNGAMWSSLKENRDTLDHLGQLHFMRKAYASQDCNPIGLLSMGQEREAQEPVDRVYGLLGIMVDRFKNQIPVDYSMGARRSFCRLYVYVTKLLLAEEFSDVLLYIESEVRPPCFPSWCPNWHSKLIVTRLPDIYCAGGQSEKSTRPEISWSLSSHCIAIRGFQITTIARTLSLELSAHHNDDVITYPIRAAAEMESLLNHLVYHYQQLSQESPRSAQERLARTLITDCRVGYAAQSDIRHMRYDQDIIEGFDWYRHFLSTLVSRGWQEAKEVRVDGGRRVNLYDEGQNHIDKFKNRVLFFTEDYGIGLASNLCREGDIVCIIPELRHPHILRKEGQYSSYALIGTTYLDGVMYGEALEGHDSSMEHDFFLT